MKDLERRFSAGTIDTASADGKVEITGLPIVFNRTTDIGWFDEVIEEGALDGTDLTDVRLLVNHDTRMIPLARSRRNNGNSTMQLSVTPEGLRMDATLDVENNATSREFVSAIERGDLSGMSFMFSVKDEEWDDLDSEHPTRRIKKIESVVEVSGVTFPAYEATSINTRCEEALESARSTVETARQQRNVEPLESDIDLDLAKAKLNFIARQ